MVARGSGRIKGTVQGQTKSSSGASDGKVAVESATVHGNQSMGNDGVRITKLGKAEKMALTICMSTEGEGRRGQ